MPSAGPCATNWYVNVAPGLIGGCVTSGTPSIEFGTSMPCQCTTVDCGNSLCTTSFTLSPECTLIHGPGTMPLYVHARTVFPGETSQSTTLAVMSNSFVPSASTFGASLTLPTPFVFAPFVSCATYAFVGAAITWSICAFIALSCASVLPVLPDSADAELDAPPLPT